MSELPTFQSHRFVMTPLSEGDCDLFSSLYSSQKVMQNVGGAFEEQTLLRRFKKLLETMASEKPLQWYWAIRCKKTKETAGVSGLSRMVEIPHQAELGIVLSPVMQNCGVAQEVLPFLISYGFQSLAMTGIVACHHPSHVAVPCVLKHLGFVVRAGNPMGRPEETKWMLSRNDFSSNQ